MASPFDPPEIGDDPYEPSPSSPWVVAALAFGLACVLPSLFFLATGFSDDPTASKSAAGAVVWLIAIEVVIGLVIGAVAWAVQGTRKPTTRRVLSALVLVVAGASGLVTGFLGGVAIAMERHPTWDDA